MAGKVQAKVFNCLQCGGQLEIVAAGISTTVSCRHCKSILDVTGELPILIRKYKDAFTFEPTIPLGESGVFGGIRWKVIGFVVRADKESDFTWQEYLLFNPWNGFRWLVESEGHFSWTKSLRSIPGQSTSGDLIYSNQKFKKFNSGTAVVKFVVGEFYWRVKTNSEVTMIDYINPPYMISSEIEKNEINWSISEYVPVENVRTAFAKAKESLGFTIGVGANQPNPYGGQKDPTLKYFLISTAALLLLAIYFEISKPPKPLYSENFSVSSESRKKSIVSSTFQISDSIGNVEFELRSPLQNNWLSTGVDLINEETGQSFEFEEGVEYYSGYDSDGSWSEGSQSATNVISEVPEGKYHLELEFQTDAANPGASVYLKRNGSMKMNFFLSLFLLAIYPLLRMLKRRSFEMRRWSNSDFNMYSSGPSNISVSETIKDVAEAVLDIDD